MYIEDQCICLLLCHTYTIVNTVYADKVAELVEFLLSTLIPTHKKNYIIK